MVTNTKPLSETLWVNNDFSLKAKFVIRWYTSVA